LVGKPEGKNYEELDTNGWIILKGFQKSGMGLYGLD
jgi:hypothetical protein